MKKKLSLLWACCILLCAAGCCAEVSESPSQGLPVVVVEEAAQALAELCGEDNTPALSGIIDSPAYLADLNGDGTYEIYLYAIDMSEPAMNLAVGFVQCYDPASGKVSAVSKERTADVGITEYEEALYIIVRTFDGSDAVVYRAALIDGKLACADIDAALQKEVLAALEH